MVASVTLPALSVATRTIGRAGGAPKSTAKVPATATTVFPSTSSLASRSTAPRRVNGLRARTWSRLPGTSSRGAVASTSNVHERPPTDQGARPPTATSAVCSPSASSPGRRIERPPVTRASPLTSLPSSSHRASVSRSASPPIDSSSAARPSAPMSTPSSGPRASRPGAARRASDEGECEGGCGHRPGEERHRTHPTPAAQREPRRRRRRAGFRGLRDPFPMEGGDVVAEQQDRPRRSPQLAVGSIVDQHPGVLPGALDLLGCRCVAREPPVEPRPVAVRCLGVEPFCLVGEARDLERGASQPVLGAAVALQDEPRPATQLADFRDIEPARRVGRAGRHAETLTTRSLVVRARPRGRGPARTRTVSRSRTPAGRSPSRSGRPGCRLRRARRRSP